MVTLPVVLNLELVSFNEALGALNTAGSLVPSIVTLTVDEVLSELYIENTSPTLLPTLSSSNALFAT
jgi:hypothetical protein